HFVPLGLLTFTCLILIVCDIFFPGTAKTSGSVDDDPVDDKNPHVKLVFDEGRDGKEYNDSMMFAVHRLFPEDKSKASLKLNWYENGAGKSTVLRIDGKDW